MPAHMPTHKLMVGVWLVHLLEDGPMVALQAFSLRNGCILDPLAAIAAAARAEPIAGSSALESLDGGYTLVLAISVGSLLLSASCLCYRGVWTMAQLTGCSTSCSTGCFFRATPTAQIDPAATPAPPLVKRRTPPSFAQSESERVPLSPSSKTTSPAAECCPCAQSPTKLRRVTFLTAELPMADAEDALESARTSSPPVHAAASDASKPADAQAAAAHGAGIHSGQGLRATSDAGQHALSRARRAAEVRRASPLSHSLSGLLRWRRGGWGAGAGGLEPLPASPHPVLTVSSTSPPTSGEQPG